ncbi:MAG: transglutaminaseTgpA domain-containing protein [Microbacteriaceae bacterium]
MSAASGARAIRRARPAWWAPGGTSSWKLSLALLVVLLLATGSLSPLLADVGWWVIAGVVATVVTTAMVVTRLTVRGRYWPLLAGVVALAVTLMVLFALRQSLLGVIPTVATVDRFSELVQAGLASISNQRVPAVADEGITFLVAVSVGVIAIVIDFLALILRRPALSGIPLFALVATASFVAPDLVDAFYFVIAGVAWVVVLHVSSPFAHARGAAVIGGVSIAAALVLQLVVIPLAPESVTTTTAPGFTPGLNPIINLGDNLRRDEPTQAMTYTTDSIRPIYFTLTTLSTFNDDGWEPARARGEEFTDLSDFIRAPGLGEEVSSEENTTEVKVGEIGGQVLPVPYAPRAIEGLQGDWQWDGTTLNVRTSTATVRAQKYTVTSGAPLPTVRDLTGIGDQPATGVDEYLEVPPDLPGVIAKTALDTTSTATTKFAKALALQAYFRGPTFAYSETAPVEQGYDGTNADIIAEFLSVRSGYCSHFASSMAVMARTLGIPSRISVGFAPGTRIRVDSETAYRVTTDNLHAWPELYFEGVGWVRFEPTPGVGSVPTFAQGNAPDPDNPTPAPTSTPEPAKTNTAAPTPQPTPGATLNPDTPLGKHGIFAPENVTRWAPALLIVLLIALLLLPALVRSSIRARRRRAARNSALPAWDELDDTARDLHLDRNETGTPRELEAALATRLGENGAAVTSLQRVRAAVEREVFSAQTADDRSERGDTGGDVRGDMRGDVRGDMRGDMRSDVRSDLDSVRRGLLAASTRWWRLRATMAPASLSWRFANRRRPEFGTSADLNHDDVTGV